MSTRKSSGTPQGNSSPKKVSRQVLVDDETYREMVQALRKGMDFYLTGRDHSHEPTVLIKGEPWERNNQRRIISQSMLRKMEEEEEGETRIISIFGRLHMKYLTLGRFRYLNKPNQSQEGSPDWFYVFSVGDGTLIYYRSIEIGGKIREFTFKHSLLDLFELMDSGKIQFEIIN